MLVKTIAALICFAMSWSAYSTDRLKCLKECKESCLLEIKNKPEAASKKEKRKAILECMITCHKTQCKK